MISTSSDEWVEKVASRIYAVSPIMDQNVDLDGRPASPPFEVAWEEMDEYDPGITLAIRDAAREIITLLSAREGELVEAAKAWRDAEDAVPSISSPEYGDLRARADFRVKRLRSALLSSDRADAGTPQRCRYPQPGEGGAAAQATDWPTQLYEKFSAWWLADGQFHDPDTDDVPWFDKRRALCWIAYREADLSAAPDVGVSMGEGKGTVSRSQPGYDGERAASAEVSDNGDGE